jgi:lipopolysaccharide O-acetyltransferase
MRKRLRNQLIRPYRVLRFHHFGERSAIDEPYWIYGAHRMSIGHHVAIGKMAWLSVERQAWDRQEPTLVIGPHTIIRQGVTISATESVVIEEFVGLGGYCSINDSNHTFSVKDGAIHNAPVVASPVRIGAGTWVGDRVAILAGANIGKGCFIGANSIIRGNIPDYSIVVGMPGRVVGNVLEQYSSDSD